MLSQSYKLTENEELLLPRPHHHQHGLTLTETLTALVLLAIGVLCIASVYLERSQAAPAVLLHSKANRLAAEMAAYIRTHRGSPIHFENPVGIVCHPELADTLSSSPQRQKQPTIEQKLANNEIACWQNKIAETLPIGTGAITYDSSSKPTAYLITVSWAPIGGGTASYLLRQEYSLIAPPPLPKRTTLNIVSNPKNEATEMPLIQPDSTESELVEREPMTLEAPAPDTFIEPDVAPAAD